MDGFESAESNFEVETPDELQGRGVNVYFSPNISAGVKVVNLANGLVDTFWEEQERPERGYYADYDSLARYCEQHDIPLTETNGLVSTAPRDEP